MRAWAAALACAVAMNCSALKAQESAPIRLNQLGELPDGIKIAANEVAINWNAPLVRVSAWLAQSEKEK